MSISYKGIKIKGTSGEYFCQIGWFASPIFTHYSEAEEWIDEHTCDFDPENIYNDADIAQSIREDAR